MLVYMFVFITYFQLCTVCFIELQVTGVLGVGGVHGLDVLLHVMEELVIALELARMESTALARTVRRNSAMLSHVQVCRNEKRRVNRIN